jgi:predicted AlkP superfamily phosphohydrolase/phosphomutase
MAEIKKILLTIIDQNNFGNIAALVLRTFPKGKDWFISSKHIDWENSSAYLTDQSGIKNYPYGGIRLKLKNSDDYERMRDIIIRELSSVKDPITNEGVINWICKREQMYSGDYLYRYPDILFELKERYGAGITTPAEVFDKSLSHNLAPGCHKQHHASFLISNCDDVELRKKNMDLMDVAPTILDLLGINWRNHNFDGESIFRK